MHEKDKAEHSSHPVQSFIKFVYIKRKPGPLVEGEGKTCQPWTYNILAMNAFLIIYLFIE